jgi:uncharacterized protein (TIGR03435 family)
MRPIVLLAITAAALAQPTTNHPVFQAASIKLGDPNSPESSMYPYPGRLVIRNYTLRQLILYAYEIKEYQLSGGPKWADRDQYSIDATLDLPADQPRGKQLSAWLRQATRALLAERFHLELRHDSKVMPGFALLQAKGGAKLQRAKSGSPGGTSNGRGMVQVSNGSLADFSGVLADAVGRPVVDKVGIQGGFDIKLTWVPDNSPLEIVGPSLYSAIQEQLGLKIEALHLPIPILVIERVEKPSEN